MPANSRWDLIRGLKGYPGMQSHISEKQILRYRAVRTSHLAEKKANFLQSTQDTLTSR